MAYTILNENPLQNSTPSANENYTGNVYVTYDNTLDQFLVTSNNKELEYVVPRGELVRDTCKYTNEVISAILSKLPNDGNYLVTISNIARTSIHLIYEANRRLF